MASYVYHFPDKLEVPIQKTQSGDKAQTLKQKLDVLASTGTDNIYLGELGYKEKRPHPCNPEEMSRSLMGKDVRDVAMERQGHGAPPCPLWERGNAFLGGRCVGSCVHQDKMLWSNIGKNWVGYKLFVMWPFKESIKMMDEFYEKLLIPPLSQKEIDYLKRVCKAVIVEPGDVYVFSGSGAHMACGLGDDLNLAAYEALLNFHSANLALFSRSNTNEHHYDCRSSRDDLDEWNLDVVDNLEEIYLKNSDSSATNSSEANSTEPNPTKKRIRSVVKEAVQELCKDHDFAYEFERLRNSKKRRTESRDFDNLIDDLLPESAENNDQNNSKPANPL